MQSVRVVPADDDDDDQATEMNNTFTGLCQLALLSMCGSVCFQSSTLLLMLAFCHLHHAVVRWVFFSAKTATCLSGGTKVIFFFLIVVLNFFQHVLANLFLIEATTSGNYHIKNSKLHRIWLLHGYPPIFLRSNLLRCCFPWNSLDVADLCPLCVAAKLPVQRISIWSAQSPTEVVHFGPGLESEWWGWEQDGYLWGEKGFWVER